MDIIKSTFDFIPQPLANVINLSPVKGVFPDKLTIAKLLVRYLKLSIASISRTTVQFRFFLIFLNSLKELCMIESQNF